MANNRMYLENEPLGIRIFIGKYYPTGGWCVFAPDKLVTQMDEAFQKSPTSMWGDTNWKITYEVVENVGCDKLAQDKVDICNCVDKVLFGAMKKEN